MQFYYSLSRVLHLSYSFTFISFYFIIFVSAIPSHPTHSLPRNSSGFLVLKTFKQFPQGAAIYMLINS